MNLNVRHHALRMGLGVVLGAALIGSVGSTGSGISGCSGKPAALDVSDAAISDSSSDGGDDGAGGATMGCPNSCRPCLVGRIKCMGSTCQCCVGNLCGPN
jgi:hypothetical protein